MLRRALAKRGIDVLVPEGLSPGSDLSAEINSLIARADLVVGVLTSERRSSWVLFELGLAWANNRPIMLIATSRSDYIPSNLQRFIVLRSKASNGEAIEFALDQLLAAPPSKRMENLSKRTLPSGPEPDALITAQRVSAAIDASDGYQLQQLVVEAFQKSRVEVVSEFSSAGRRADMAIWSDDLETVVGNPLLVEIKLQLRSSSDAKEAASALASHVAASGTRWGLLLYGKGFAPSGKIHGWLPPNILAIDLPTLFEQMRRQSFSDVVKDLRNRRVHGSVP